MRASIPLFYVLILSTSACAAKHSAPAPDYPYDDAGGMAEMAEMADQAQYGAEASMAAPSPSPAGGAKMPAQAGSGLGTAGVFASPEPLTKPDAIGEDELETIGAESVDQMLIFTGQLVLQVEFGHTAKAIDAAVGLAVASGGYVAEMTDTSLRLRVPSKRFRKLMNQLEDLGGVQSRGVSALDVSEEFHDLQVELDNLEATRARVEKLLNQAKDLNQVLTIEKELQRITSEIDRIKGRMRLLSSQAAFSTISLALGERPRQEEIKIAEDDQPPPQPPRTLSGSAPWVGGVGVHGLMNLSN